MRAWLFVMLTLAGCVDEAPAATVPDVEPAPAPSLQRETLAVTGSCQAMHTTQRGQMAEVAFSMERPEGFSHLRIEIDWQAVAAPGSTLGAFIMHEAAPPFVEHAWNATSGSNPLVLGLDNRTWEPAPVPGTSAPSVDLVLHAHSSLPAAAIASCDYDVTVDVFTAA